MSDSSRVQMRYLAEVSWGVTPATQMTDLRMTGESLKYNIGNDKSSEIRSDRQTTDLIQTSFDASGDINFELSYGTYDDFFKAALYSSGWSTIVATSETDISAVAAGNSIDTAAGDFVADGIVVGQWLDVRGFTTNGTQFFCKVVSVTTASIVVSGITLVNEGPLTITMAGAFIRNGVLQESFTMEKEFSDITQFAAFEGMVPNTLAINVESQSKMTGSIGFTGKSGLPLAGSSVGTGGADPASTTQVMSVGSHVQDVYEGGVLLSASAYAKTVNVALNNNNRMKDAVGETGAVGISSGTVEVTGSLTAYFETAALYNKFVNNTASTLSYGVRDDAGNAYIITLPNIKYSDGSVVAGGQNEFVVVEMPFEALRDATTDCMIQIDRFVA